MVTFYIVTFSMIIRNVTIYMSIIARVMNLPLATSLDLFGFGHMTGRQQLGLQLHKTLQSNTICVVRVCFLTNEVTKCFVVYKCKAEKSLTQSTVAYKAMDF